MFKMLSGIINVDIAKFYSVLPYRTIGGSEKIFFRSPRTTQRLVVFTCRADLFDLFVSKIQFLCCQESFQVFQTYG